MGDDMNNFETLSEKDIGDLYSELSAHSLMVLQRYLRYCHLGNMCRKYVNTAQHDSIIVPLENMFPGIKAKIAFEAKTCRKLAKRTCFKTFSPEAGCYHHGLTCVEPEILAYIKNSVFLDLGAYNGDSSFVFSSGLTTTGEMIPCCCMLSMRKFISSLSSTL